MVVTAELAFLNRVNRILLYLTLRQQHPEKWSKRKTKKRKEKRGDVFAAARLIMGTSWMMQLSVPKLPWSKYRHTHSYTHTHIHTHSRNIPHYLHVCPLFPLLSFKGIFIIRGACLRCTQAWIHIHMHSQKDTHSHTVHECITYTEMCSHSGTHTHVHTQNNFT